MAGLLFCQKAPQFREFRLGEIYFLTAVAHLHPEITFPPSRFDHEMRHLLKVTVRLGTQQVQRLDGRSFRHAGQLTGEGPKATHSHQVEELRR